MLPDYPAPLHTFRLFLILSLTLFIQPVNAETDEINRQVLKGLDHCYNFRWDSSEEVFRKIIEKHPEDPRGYHYLSTVYLWYYISTNEESDYNAFLKYSDLVIEKSELLLNADNADTDLKYLLGTNYSCRSIIFTRAGNYLDAIWASKTSESLLSEVIKLNPDNYDAYLGLGLYNFAVDQIPSAFKWTLNLAGISGDENTGLTYIRNAAEKAIFCKVEAQFYLSQILSEVKMDYKSAGTHLKNLTSKYPQNLLFNYSLGVLEIKKRNLEQAEKHIIRVLKGKNEKFKQINTLAAFLMGDILYRKNKYKEASSHYHDFLNSAVNEDYTGIASFRLAVCYEMLNDRNNSVFHFNKALNGNTDLDDDNFAKRKGTIYLNRPLTMTEKKLIKFSNMIEAGDYKEAIDSLTVLLDNNLSEKIRAEVYLHLSEAAFFNDSTEHSLNYALKALELNPEEEKWIHPFAAYYSARSYRKMNNQPLMEEYIDKFEDYNNYDYQNKLTHLVESFR